MHSKRRFHALGRQRHRRQAPRRQRVSRAKAAQDVVNVVVELLTEQGIKPSMPFSTKYSDYYLL